MRDAVLIHELFRALFGELIKYVLGERVIFTLMGLALAVWFAYSGIIEIRRRRLVYAAMLIPLGLLFAVVTGFLTVSK